jgi:protein gp37
MAEYLAAGRGPRGRFGKIEQACLDFHDMATATEWPLPNVWLGVSAEDQPRLNERWKHLARCPAAVRFLGLI